MRERTLELPEHGPLLRQAPRRALSETETAALASLLDRVGGDRLAQVVISFSAEALSDWLADPPAE